MTDQFSLGMLLRLVDDLKARIEALEADVYGDEVEQPTGPQTLDD